MSGDLAAQLTQKAFDLGFSRVGIIPARPAARLDAYRRWIGEQMHGEMGYMARPDRVSRRQDLQVILPGAQSLICVAVDYFPGRLPPQIARDPGRGRIANYAWGVDYHHIMTPRLQELADWLAVAAGGGVRNRVYVDTGAILERDHGETAALGFTGKNTMLIHPRHGSFFFLGEILTTTPIHNSQLTIHNSQFPTCGSCHRCLDACPTHAFPAPYLLDARRCISYLTIELKGWIPRELRPLTGNWVYGCDICQNVCPFNRFAGTKIHNSQFTIHNSLLDTAAPPLVDLLTLDENEFNRRFAHSPIKRIKRARLVRNACVAAGNWGNETAVGSVTAVPPLITLLSDPEPIVRGHAAWALGQIGGKRARTAVAHALKSETDENVRQEMRLSITLEDWS